MPLSYNRVTSSHKSKPPAMDHDNRPPIDEYRAQLERRKELQSELRAELAAGAKRQGMGCLTSLAVIILLAITMTAIISPWAFYIGGRFTPLNTWEGYGKLHSSTGADYGLFLHLGEYSRRRSRRNLTGSAALCTPQGIVYNYSLDGRIESVWLFTEAKNTSLSLSSPKNEPIKSGFELHGRWENGGLVLSDQGSMGKPFHADGSLDPRGRYTFAPLKGEHAEGTIAFGRRFDFEELCANEIGKRK